MEVVATAGALTECEACEAGSYCAGGDNAAEPCAADTWDDDENPATPCVARSICSAGYFVTDPGGLTEDRSCEPCPNGAFSAAPNADQCTPWTECPAGSSVASAGTRTRDRTCQECSAGHYTSQANSPSCSAWATCSAPSQYMTQPPSSTRDRSCSTCQAPALTREDNATSCLVPAFRMSNGRVVMEAEHYHFTTSQGSTDAWYPIQLAGVSNGRCVELGPDDGDLHAWLDDVAATAPRLDYYVDFDEAGTFDLFLRGDAGVASWGASNSCHAGLNDQPLADYFDFPQQNHQWRWISHPLIVPSAGIHRVQIWGREDGFRLDKIVIQRPSSAPPSGHGPAESSTH